MSESNENAPAQETSGEEQRGPLIEIELTRTGLTVRGNNVLKNPALAYGMLEMAKDTLRQQYMKANESPIARVPFMPPGLTSRG